MSTPIDACLSLTDNALRTVFATHHAQRACPQASIADELVSEKERREAGALMRVNHVGEVCAQALYNAQAWATQNSALKAHFKEASQEETDHLAWTEQRLAELGERTSLLNPLWYAGAFGIGLLVGKLGGDRISLGFVVETERQVEAHLQSHMDRLPVGDKSSRAIIEQMKTDEVRHALDAQKAGALELPGPVKSLMRMAARVMTTIAHRI